MTQRNLELFSRPFRKGRGFWTWNCVSSPDIGSRELCQHVQNWTELSITISRLARTLLGFCLLRVCPAWELASFVLRPSKRPKLAFALRSRGWNSVFRFSRFWLPELGFVLGVLDFINKPAAIEKKSWCKIIAQNTDSDFTVHSLWRPSLWMTSSLSRKLDWIGWALSHFRRLDSDFLGVANGFDY